VPISNQKVINVVLKPADLLTQDSSLPQDLMTQDFFLKEEVVVSGRNRPSKAKAREYV
jgi:hypothetical protein